MTLERTETFFAWLDKQLAENHLTDTQLANKAGISHMVISKARKGMLPKWDPCLAIARAFRVDEVELIRVWISNIERGQPMVALVERFDLLLHDFLQPWVFQANQQFVNVRTVIIIRNPSLANLHLSNDLIISTNN